MKRYVQIDGDDILGPDLEMTEDEAARMNEQLVAAGDPRRWVPFGIPGEKAA